jgi:Secretion system C-terminal sorting domain
MKKLILLFSLLTGLANAQPQLSIAGYGSYLDPSFSTFPYFTFFDIEVDNVDSFATFNDTLYLAMGVEDPPGIVTPMSATSAGMQTIPPLDSVILDTTYFAADTSFFKEGNNTVVIWPYAGVWPGIYTKDSLYFTIYITGFSIIEENNIPITIGPNPAADVLCIYDPKNLAIRVTIHSMNGQLMATSTAKGVFDLRLFTNGIYILEMETRKGILTRKLIIDR